jgi:hypothetical protein
MAQTFNGIGSTYYGKKKFEDDDSFVTTKWFVIGFFPLVPLASARMRYLDSSGIPFLARTASYEHLEDLPIDWVQVLCTYAYAIFIIFWFAKIASGNMNPVGKVVALALGVSIPFVLRWFSKMLRR